MAGPSQDTAALIANVKRRCAVPTSQLTFLPADFTDLATDELQGIVVPKIMATREDFFLEHEDFTTVDGALEIPSYAAGEKLRLVAYLQSSNPLVLINLPRIDLDVVAGLGGPAVGLQSVVGFYVEGNTLRLYPGNAAPQTIPIRLYYYKRVLALAAPSTYGKIVSIDTGSDTLQLSFVPNDWEAGTVLNAVSGSSPFGVTSEEMTIVGVSSPSIIVDSVDGLSVGDYVSLQGYSAVPQVLLEAHAWLAQRVAVKVLEGVGASGDKVKLAQAKADELYEALLIFISQRVDGSVKKVMSPNGGLRFGAGLSRVGVGRR